mmetsp:Transcript_40710/g.105687  ORF Transcript_40710/g.105687 Transcript_40710/m.105687 type:complete len:253 (+) Transcript_40710:308-1066(+)
MLSLIPTPILTCDVHLGGATVVNKGCRYLHTLLQSIYCHSHTFFAVCFLCSEHGFGLQLKLTEHLLSDYLLKRTRARSAAVSASRGRCRGGRDGGRLIPIRCPLQCLYHVDTDYISLFPNREHSPNSLSHIRRRCEVRKAPHYIFERTLEWRNKVAGLPLRMLEDVVGDVDEHQLFLHVRTCKFILPHSCCYLLPLLLYLNVGGDRLHTVLRIFGVVQLLPDQFFRRGHGGEMGGNQTGAKRKCPSMFCSTL